jgi:hypothetical protein
MSLKIDRLQLEIIINNDQARTSLRNLNDEALQIQKSMKKMVEGSDEWVQASKRLSTIKDQMDNIYESIGITGLSLTELRKKQQEFNMVLNQIPASSPQYAQYKKTLDEINARIAELRGKAQSVMPALEGEGGLSGAFSKLSSWALKFGAAALAAFSLNAIKDYVAEGIKAAKDLSDVETLLLENLNGQKDVQQDLINLAKEKANTTLYKRQELEDAENFLAIQQRTPAQIKKTIDAATQLSVVTGKDLMDSVRDLDATMEGKLGRGLGKLAQDFQGLTKEQLFHGDAIEIVRKKYAGLAEGEMNTIGGKLNLLGKAWSNLQRTIGEAVVGQGNIFGGIIQGATDLLNVFKKWIEIPLSQKISEEKEALNNLVFQIQATNTNQAERNRLIDELRAKYPEFLGSLKDEDITNQYLAKHLMQVNYQYMEKIRIAKSEETLTAMAEKEADASKKLASLEKERNLILQQSMDLLYQSNAMVAHQVELAPTMDQKIELVKKYLSQTGEAFLNAAARAKQAEDKMKQTQIDFSAASIKIAEDAINGSLNLTNSLENVSDQILQIGLQTKDETLKTIIQTEMEDRARMERIATYEKNLQKEKIDFTKKTETELNEIISRAREEGATNIDRTNARLAQQELKHREDVAKVMEKYQDLMREISEMEKTNFADKLSQTQKEIQAINDKYNAEIQKAEEFERHNKKDLSPKQTETIDQNIDQLKIARDAQTKQVLEQAELDFAEKIKQIHEALRVGRMSITNRELYEINKKYDDLQKEILDAIQYRYDQEVKQANGNTELIAQAEKNKAQALEKIQGDMSLLEQARDQETRKAKRDGDIKFEDDLRSLRLKGEEDLAKGKEKIQDEVNSKYRKLLDENVNDEAKTAEIKAQMAQDLNARIEQYEEEHLQKMIQKYAQYASTILSALSGLEQAFTAKENAELKIDETTNNKKKDNLKAQLTAGKITQKQYDDQVAQMDSDLDKKKAKLEHDQAVRQKAISIVQAIINTAQAITAALTIPIVGEALAIVVGILGAAQIALIASTPVPEAAEGQYDVIGQKSGKKYSKVPYAKNPKTGIYGKPTLINETGDEIIIDPYTTKNLVMNYPEIIDGINNARVPQRSAGQYNQVSSITAMPSSAVFNAESLQVMRDFIDAIKNPKPIPAYTIWSETELLNKKMASIEKDVSKSAA